MATISENQRKYLTAMAAGKNEKGQAAGSGQQAWAKSQLANSTSPNNTTQSASTFTQPESRTNQTLNRINELANAQPFQYQAPAAFTYDQNSDPAYQAALASARSNITQQQADTNAHLRAGGQGKSSYSESVANQIGAKEMGRVSTDVLPQLINQAYQRHADNANRDMQIQQANYGAQQDQVTNLARLYGMQDQQDFANPMAEAQLTGQYLSGEARQYIDAINGLKAQAEAKGTSREAMLGYKGQADAYRNALQGLGVDPSLFGSDVNRSTAMQNANRAGVQTMAAKDQNFGQDMATKQYDRGVLENDRNYNRGVLESDRTFGEDTRRYNQEFEYTQGRDKVADERWQTEFDRILTQDGVQNALAWAQNSISQQNANTSSGNLNLSRDEFDYRKEKDVLDRESSNNTSDSISGNKITAKQSADNYSLLYDDITSEGVDKDTARNLLKSNQAFLTDADYKKLNQYINDKL
ncbi:hypothetical protein [Paenibacillus sp. L3-i20]|uniref:hypothetical protein n=1 Tax=Paenibacillus sp. L3-i20 TaxID=2905833 RepID=UPI001EDD0FA0|nr:hypothetical protein [Paenibacillus sp. L3-i20]GKU76838.1 hypothetical protein L3i20_v212350 [Paenibacillus sp. L3-i20]